MTLIAEASEGGIVNSLRSEGRLKHWLNDPNANPGSDLFLADQDKALVGYAVVHRELECGRVILGGAVNPGYGEQGIATRLMDAALAHSHAIGARQVRVPITSAGGGRERYLVREYGFVPVRYHWVMRLDSVDRIVQAEPPPGFSLWPFTSGDELQLAAIQNRAFARRWEFHPNTVGEIRHRVAAGWCCPEGILFIGGGGEVVGYCWTAIDEGQIRPGESRTGYVEMLGISPYCRRQGLGRSVVTAGIAYLRGRGMNAVELIVDRRNWRARRLYESLGFRRKSVIVWYQKAL